MASVRKTQTLHYDKYMNSRQRVMRFLQDNRDMYVDYPENTLRRVDSEDLRLLDYYTGPFANYCFYGGFASTLVLGAGVLFLHKMNISKAVKLVSILVPMIPMFGSTLVHYQVSGRFLDYCSTKYEDRGLWDTELWEYHRKRHGENEIVQEWSIGK